MKEIIVPSMLGIIFFANAALGQKNQTVTINTLRDDEKSWARQAYQYPAFQDGKVVFKDSVTVEAKLNYHRSYGQILFINPKGDTLALSSPETFMHVVIGTDTFYYHDKGFLRKLTHYKNGNLAVKQAAQFIGKETKGAYGTYSATAATNSNSTVTTDDQITNYIGTDQNLLFKIQNQFFFSDAFNNFFRASKKNVYNLFSNREKEIKAYLDSNKVDFNKQEDLEKLLAYIYSL